MSESISISEIFSSIQGEGFLAGRRQIFVRLFECNLKCRYCDTDNTPDDFCRVEISPGSGEFSRISQPLTLQSVTGMVSEWCKLMPGAHHSISITGGEPLLHAGILRRWLPELRRLLPIHLETNGTLPDELEQVIDSIDYISMDVKVPSVSGCGTDLWDRHRRFLSVAHGRNVSVKAVIGDDTTGAEIRQLCSLIADVERSTPLFLQPLSHHEGGVALQAARMLRLQAIAAEQLPDVRVIPQMHKMLEAL